MGVYNPDMKMPKSCTSCPFTLQCKALPKAMGIDYAEKLGRRRHPDCRLQEVTIKRRKNAKEEK